MNQTPLGGSFGRIKLFVDTVRICKLNEMCSEIRILIFEMFEENFINEIVLSFETWKQFGSETSIIQSMKFTKINSINLSSYLEGQCTCGTLRKIEISN